MRKYILALALVLSVGAHAFEVSGDHFKGKFKIDSIEEARNRLSNQGIEVTPIKKGIKENTLVATIKSHTNNVPTLLIQHL